MAFGKLTEVQSFCLLIFNCLLDGRSGGGSCGGGGFCGGGDGEKEKER